MRGMMDWMDIWEKNEGEEIENFRIGKRNGRGHG
jgi:hypothetical protein